MCRECAENVAGIAPWVSGVGHCLGELPGLGLAGAAELRAQAAGVGHHPQLRRHECPHQDLGEGRRQDRSSSWWRVGVVVVGGASYIGSHLALHSGAAGELGPSAAGAVAERRPSS